jgi:hypothetical protein
MSNETKSGYWWFLWLCVAVIGFAALMVFFLLSKSTTPTTRRVTITMDTNGTARLGGVPLLTTNIRDGTFATMGALGVKAGLLVPTTSTNKTQESNLLETLKSMSRAGLFSTNQPPNPYE